MNVLGVYRPGNTLLHRLPAGVKFVAMGVVILVLSLTVRSLTALGIATAGVAVVYALAGIGPREAWRQLRPLMWLLLFIFAFQVVFTDWRRAVIVCGVLALSVALAAAVSLTTRTTDMLDTIVRALGPLRRLGVRVDLIALALALTIRAIPLMVEVVREVDEARKARGLRPGPRILVAPVVLAALRTADGFADTLTARGLD
ncbi:energy-coupling factor transporter transmembrane protein EcfT [Gordonia sp. JH63]|uniref:Energy-coupling factor transporter transmembrane protein EcfT n=1 Tax=Gordonia hongkongensis TaxID=1701090 RepID=A0AAX3TBS1_9ACTN|nr:MULTISPECIES: energy-coupling factor transporter transmembrane protein EcfT [Gordonia]OCW85270.1 cobalt ABC transporter [Nocardia farcinica]QIK48722.1 energy-coupling factor transporter transmembrane protein EcfT [Gordonia terrae]MBN0971393.1 energy-coupling factor transporter transmembrane protein EcfT [Gordonia sp. BP-119]MBN0982234.1 energy-coupling factor transporter transmembrane protein EcfT [Gordonia sp. BP-94]MBR7190754.1 energy-coupling factor transporter transmembrane protein EcfT